MIPRFLLVMKRVRRGMARGVTDGVSTWFLLSCVEGSLPVRGSLTPPFSPPHPLESGVRGLTRGFIRRRRWVQDGAPLDRATVALNAPGRARCSADLKALVQEIHVPRSGSTRPDQEIYLPRSEDPQAVLRRDRAQFGDSCWTGRRSASTRSTSWKMAQQVRLLYPER